MYSQNNEEEIIVVYFGALKGKFLDIGAYDGKKFSNTHKLCELGWTGVCVEPSPIIFVNLIKNMKEFPLVKLINAAISEKSEILKFFDSNGDALSSFSKAHCDKWEKGYGSKFSEIYIKTITLDEIFVAFGSDYEFINLDVEGLNYELFLMLHKALVDGKLSKLKCVCIEHDQKNAVMENVMNGHGFRRIGLNGENIIMGR